MSSSDENLQKSAREEKQKTKIREKRRAAWLWVVKVFVFSFVLSSVISLLSGELVNSINVIAAGVLLFLIILVGVTADVIGLAVATAEEKPFHSMAARKLREGKKGVWLIRNADKVSNICNDVIGDIAGVVSGATGTAIVVHLALSARADFYVSLLVTGMISALTVGGKAYGKTIALSHNNAIVNIIAKIMCIFSKK